MELVVFVGIPASGKSTESEKYRAAGYQVLSSDEIRNGIMQGVSLAEVSKEEQDRINAIVFDTIYAQATESLSRGESVVVDATHVFRNYRMDLLKRYERFHCKKKCLLFITPFEVCLQRNHQRSGPALVPDDIMLWMLGSFQCPTYSEGWDEIVPVISDAPYKLPFTETDNFTPGTAEYNNCLSYLHLVEKCCRDDFSPEDFPTIIREIN